MPYDYYNINTPISELIDKFIQSKKHLRKMSIRAYHTLLKRFYKHTQEELVTEESLKTFLKYVKSRKIAQKTYNNYLNILKVYVHWLKKRKHIDDISFLSDFQGFQRPETILLKKFYPEEKVREFLQVKPRWFHYFLFLAFYFAFRPHELARLETKDIHLSDKYIEVRPNVQKVRKLDYLAIPELFENKFHELLTWRERQKSAAPQLLVNRFGTTISRPVLDYHCQKLRKVDPNFRYYYCRYTAAWRAYKQTKDIYLVQQLLRHTSPSKTVIYLGIQKDEVLSIQRKQLDKVFSEVQL